VWFLAGATTQSTLTRNCTIPANKRLFFPILNAVYIGYYPSVLGDTPAYVRQAIQEYMDSLLAGATLAVEVDGKPINLSSQNRIASPVFYKLKLSKDNIYGVTSNDCPSHGGFLVCSPNAADGVYLLLNPLSLGKHVIHFSASGFLDVTYNLTVKKPGKDDKEREDAARAAALDDELPLDLFLPFTASDHDESPVVIPPDPCPEGVEPNILICG
jgi:hypothetical protein